MTIRISTQVQRTAVSRAVIGAHLEAADATFCESEELLTAARVLQNRGADDLSLSIHVAGSDVFGDDLSSSNPCSSCATKAMPELNHSQVALEAPLKAGAPILQARLLDYL